MFKKLTNFFFREETIEIEELNTKNKKEDYEILEIKPVAQKTVEKKVTEIKQEEVKVEEKTQEETVKRKPVLIDLEDTPIIPKQTTYEEKQIVKTTNGEKKSSYHPKEVISPMLGGKEKESSPLVVKPKIAKSRKPLTEVISPMLGRVAEEKDNDHKTGFVEIKDLDLEEIITPVAKEEVQVSLFDYIEGLNHEE